MYSVNRDNVDVNAKNFTPLKVESDNYQQPTNTFCVRNMFQNHFYNIKSHMSGFGDFIRGSCSLYNLCKQKNWKLEICFCNYPEMSSCFKCNHTHPPVDPESVPYIPWPGGYQIVEKYIQNDIQQNKTISCLSTNIFPRDGSVTPDFQQFMKEHLQLSDKLQAKYDSIVGDIPEGTYTVLHLRTPDRYQPKSATEYLTKALEHIQLVPKITYVLCMDIEYRDSICEKYGYQKLNTTSSAHLGIDGDINGTENTIIEFAFMSKAQCIYAVTPLNYGTGFSEWCAKVYNIPLTYCICYPEIKFL